MRKTPIRIKVIWRRHDGEGSRSYLKEKCSREHLEEASRYERDISDRHLKASGERHPKSYVVLFGFCDFGDLCVFFCDFG